MSAVFEGRLSDSPYVEIVWRGWVEGDYAPVCPADARWNLLFTWHGRRVKVTAEGPTTHFVPKTQPDGMEFLVIKFKLGTYMPYFPVSELVDGDILLPDAASQSFWLNGSVWELPNFDNVETFVERLAREGILIQDAVVSAALQDQAQPISSRTVRRRFLRATGLTPVGIRQIERAQQAASLLEKGVPILDTVYELGYADQPHLTRALRRFYGLTPLQIARAGMPVSLPE